MRLSMQLLTVVVLFLLAGVVPGPDGASAGLFRTPVFAALLGLAAVALGACALRRRGRGSGFVLLHAGLAVVLLGAGLGVLFEERARFALPVDPDLAIRRIFRPMGQPLDLGFALTVTGARVETYPPTYHLFPSPGETADAGGVPAGSFAPDAQGRLFLPDRPPLPAAALRDAAGGWRDEAPLADGAVLRRGAAVPKRYEVVLHLSGDAAASGPRLLAVNRPVTCNGWRLYLMDLDPAGGGRVVLLARRDPGRGLVIAGM
ncbi:MAG: hypothetical protein ACOCX4_08615, partial [Planctomycetota bacterium]